MAERYRSLDALRGVAVMGILLINIIAFALPESAALNPRAAGLQSSADVWAWAVAFVLVEGKMRALFTFLFGASMLLVIDRADAAQRRGARVHLVRMAVLFIIGAAHFVLLWHGDILHHYALIGVVALLFVRLPTPALVRIAIGAFAVSVIIFAIAALGFVALKHDASQAGASASVVRAWQGVETQFGANTADVARETKLYRGNYTDMVAARLSDNSADAIRILLFTGVETLGLMLLGMWGLRSGFVTGAWTRHRYRGWAALCYLIGVPPLIVLAALTWRSGFEPATLFLAVFAGGALFRPIVMLGHAAALMSLLASDDSAFVDRLAATGRAAFSNYLGTTVLMTTLFYGYGFGLFGTLSRAQLYMVVPAVWAMMLLWSKPWLDRYRFGPAEWLWRSLARGRAQPMRIT